MDRPPATRLQLRLLGVPTWATEHDDGLLKGNLALLVAVVATEGNPNAAWLTQQLWGPDGAGSNLHTNVNRLRERTEHRVLEAAKSVELRPDVAVDIHAAPEHWPTGDDPARVEFLHGIQAPATLQPWLEAERARWRQRLAAGGLLRRAEDLAAADTLPAALDAVRQAIGEAPDLPEAWLAKSLLLYLTGDAVGARRALARADTLGPLRSDAGRQADELRRTLEAAVAPRPRRLPPSLIRPPELIGRDAAWLAAERAWEARRPFVFVGEHGVGKSRLLGDFVQHHGAGLVVEAPFQAERAPYATLAAVVNAVLGLVGGDPGELPAALRAVMGLPDTAGTDARFDETAVLAASREWFTDVAESVGALAIDRLERADAATIELLRKLAAGPLREHLRFGFAARPLMPGPRRDPMDAWCSAPDGLRLVALAPWTVEQVAALLRTLDLPRAAARITPAELHARTGGVARLVLFTLQELAARDSLPAARAAAAGPAEALPLLLHRLRAIAPAARRVLELCAVMDAAVALLAQALECSDLEVQASLDELALHDVLAGGLPIDDTTRAAVLATMPAAAVARWNAVAATLLASDPRVPRARIAAHWEAAERWAEAAAAFREAAARAVAVGSAAAALDLFLQAARCAALCGDAAAEFDALHDALPHELALPGRDAALRLLERLQALAPDSARRVRAGIQQAVLELAAYRRGPAAEPTLQAAEAALAAAQDHGDTALLAGALSAHAVALAQRGRRDEAVDQGRRAHALARLACTPRRAREIGTDLCFVYYECSRLRDGIALLRELLAEYEAAGDVASAAVVEGNLANVLARSGDLRASLAPAQRAHRRLRELEPTATHAAAVVNRVGISQGLAFRGELREALAVLSEAGEPLAEHDALPQIRAMVRTQRAHLLLLLGDDAAARATLGDDAGLPSSQLVQMEVLRLRALRMQGAADADVLARLAKLLQAEDTTPLPHSPWWAASLFGDPAHAAERLAEVQRRSVECGMEGVARSVAVRRLQLLAAVDARWAIDEASRQARVLHRDLLQGAGLAAMTYLPEAWLAVAVAWQRAGEVVEAAAALKAARVWVRHCEEHHVPPERRQAFRHRNPVNRALLEGQP